MARLIKVWQCCIPSMPEIVCRGVLAAAVSLSDGLGSFGGINGGGRD